MRPGASLPAAVMDPVRTPAASSPVILDLRTSCLWTAMSQAMRPLASLDKTDGGSNDVNLWRIDNDTFIHHQMLDAAAGIGPVEPNPTRAQVSLAWSEKLYK